MTPKDPRDDDRFPRSRTPMQYGLMLLGIYVAMHVAAGALVRSLTPADAYAATTTDRSIAPDATPVAPSSLSVMGQTASDDSRTAMGHSPASTNEATEDSHECEQGAATKSVDTVD